ncbi:ATP-binding cassette domain-containing protein [Nocardioides sp. 1609]|uniref:ABC transporter ATP-binding protein n=1 Tax=Nocardioides sp. 1609 TaxID=2508327 RepID=UPI001ADC3D6B|nr:ATP-binding cassette domain-containing protein [Nocardioides sp. 1609]
MTVKYHSLIALDGVSMDIELGAIHGIIGPNGAGKSTLMDVVCGGKKLAAGEVSFEDKAITKLSVRTRRRLGISRCFQRTSIFPELEVGEQLELAASRFADHGLDEIIEALGISSLLDEVANTIAYGDQRRVDLALALLGRPRLLLLDEPAAGLSVAETHAVFTHLTDLVRDRGITAVVVEHDVDAVFSFCDTVTVLDLGRVLASGAPSEVRTNPAVIKAYLGTAA